MINSVDKQKDNQTGPSSRCYLRGQRIAYLTTTQKTPQTLRWASTFQRETNHNSCSGESIIYLYCFIIAILIPHAMVRTVINVCIDTCVDKRSSYLWLSCCDHRPGSISVSHSCSCARTSPSAEVHRGHLKPSQKHGFEKSQTQSISAAKKGPMEQNVQSNHPGSQRMWNDPHRCRACHGFFEICRCQQHLSGILWDTEMH